MKKTFITLLALAGVASAESVGYNSMTTTQQKDVAFAWDFSAGSNTLAVGYVNMGSKDWPSDDFSLTSSNTATVGTQGTQPWSARVTGVGSNFTVSLDVNSIADYGTYKPKDGKYQAIFSLYSDNASTYCFNCITLGFDSNGSIVLTTKGENDNGYGGAGDHTISTGLTVSDIDDTTFTLVSDAENNTLTLYVNGEQLPSGSQITGWTAGENKSLALTGFQFGSSFSEKNQAYSMEVSNITVWNAALTSDTVKSLTVPEPTTATLSLLALAGLAARRRRH